MKAANEKIARLESRMSDMLAAFQSQQTEKQLNKTFVTHITPHISEQKFGEAEVKPFLSMLAKNVKIGSKEGENANISSEEDGDVLEEQYS